MTTTEEIPLSLITMAQGAVEERLEDALQDMLKDCLNPNLKSGPRVVTLEISLAPNDDRTSADITIKVKTKGQPPMALATRAYIGMGHNGRPEAFEVRRTQMPIPMATNQPMLVRGGAR